MVGPKPSEVVSYKDGDFDNIGADNLEWKPKWWVLENNRQKRRMVARRSGQVYREESQQVYDSTLVAAKELGLIEQYILLAIQTDGIYGGSRWSWERNR